MKQTLSKNEREAGILRAIKAFLDVKSQIGRTRSVSNKNKQFKPFTMDENGKDDAGKDILDESAPKTQHSGNQASSGLLW